MTNKPFASIAKTKSGLGDLNRIVDKIRRTRIYVGVAEGADGDVRGGDEPNSCLNPSCELVGSSPYENIPPRPFLQAGVQYNKGTISGLMRGAMEQALSDDLKGFDKRMEAAALTAAASVQEYMVKADFAPLSPMTIRERLKRNPNQDPATMKPLIDTGSLRQAIQGIVIEED